jgi:hypothetical protein
MNDCCRGRKAAHRGNQGTWTRRRDEERSIRREAVPEDERTNPVDPRGPDELGHFADVREEVASLGEADIERPIAAFELSMSRVQTTGHKESAESMMTGHEARAVMTGHELRAVLMTGTDDRTANEKTIGACCGSDFRVDKKTEIK